MVQRTKLTYEVIEGWEKLPAGFRHLDAVGAACDADDRVYVITRMESRVIVYERDGTFVDAWGEGIFTPRTHCIRFGPDGSVYTVDDGDHTVRKFTPDGKLLLTIGTPGVASETGYDPTAPTLYDKLASITHGGPPFNKPTGVAIAPNGEIYVSDGYGNARVHRFTPEGILIQSWGEPGTGPGQFNLPHDVWVLPDGRLLVADRENERIQFFGPDGKYLDQWTGVQHPTGLFVDREGLVYVSELGWRTGEQSFTRGIVQADAPGRVSVFDPNGKLLARWGGADVCAPGNFIAPHGICADSRGDIYVAEVTYTIAGSRGLVPPDAHTLQKFVRRVG